MSTVRHPAHGDAVVAGALAVVGQGPLASAVSLLQPLALSAGTRKAIRRQEGLLVRTRAAEVAVTGEGRNYI